ncbi:peptidoglycan recognition protein family protein [Nocardia brevicatena]|uniref:peptidoglycan recognition protein family protein n=1 Tax=Nocardia brevicatena TaxID=37327 RepID=UPI000684B04D|nr:peptidoglycan recognition family protein [Nocardia brevicatena]
MPMQTTESVDSQAAARPGRRAVLAGALALAGVGLVPDAPAGAQPPSGIDCRGARFVAVPPEVRQVRFRLNGAWADPVTVRAAQHGRDDRQAALSEPLAVPAGAEEISAGSSGAVGLFGPPLAQPFRKPVTTSYTWGFPVVTRSGWGADESLMTWGEPEFAPAQLITVHHSAIPDGTEYSDYRDAVLEIFRYHALPAPNGQGWGDIGYHLVIDPNGVVYAGRSTGTTTEPADDSPIFEPGSKLTRGAQIITAGHVVGANTGNIGICMIGDFTHHLPSKPALHSLDIVLARLCTGLELDPFAQVHYVNPVNGNTATMPAISGHRDWQAIAGPTDCPADFLHGALPLLRGLSEVG